MNHSFRKKRGNNLHWKIVWTLHIQIKCMYLKIKSTLQGFFSHWSILGVPDIDASAGSNIWNCLPLLLSVSLSFITQQSKWSWFWFTLSGHWSCKKKKYVTEKIPLIDVKFASGTKNIPFFFLPIYTDVCKHCILSTLPSSTNKNHKRITRDGFKPMIFVVLICVHSDEKGFRFQYFSEKLPLSQKLYYSKESCFSQWFILSTALHCLLTSKFL